MDLLNTHIKIQLSIIDWTPDWKNEEEVKFYLIYDHVDKMWLISQDVHIQIPGIVYMPEALAEEIFTNLKNNNVHLDNLEDYLMDVSKQNKYLKN